MTTLTRTDANPWQWSVPCPPVRDAGRLRELVSTILCGLRVWRERAVTRRYLRSLDDHRLKDIGWTRFDAMVEASKPFWRA